ncbi:SulP family inorganic anion transporter [Oceanihabitans sediminis]|uniref:SulP family inorganic anion transporter n=1 Tax=Oceanihabitans sediminis TaxID=1812012 RepID=A0A368P328_9FLAO|nr:SulP family inorganic anion transporter [Oceanihabitans sediminis]MDX1278625.1 SulP family inorganic anion transporter [Oceanihabitans sediminis]MDX1774302.1 SulP family inorganic anion transporter [Oceanihabitans sediminis]RBP29896.1 SulP family sulfate permease [Oceanihabitans sediminis]RCU57232.1 SulP family inorganic anion transporter [Oceanihabitans sediminis]
MTEFIRKIVPNAKDDVLAGITVSLAMIPEVVAFAFVAQIDPLMALSGAFIVGLISAIFGGRPGLITGAAGAVAVIFVNMIAEGHTKGMLMDTPIENMGFFYLMACVVLMGLIQILAGVFKLGRFVRLIPHPVMMGFVNGLSIVIFMAQIKMFSHKSLVVSPEGVKEYINTYMQGAELYTMIGLVLLTMGVIWGLPRLTKKLPAALTAILITTLVVIGFNLDVSTVGSYIIEGGGTGLKGEFPTPNLELWEKLPFNLDTLKFIALPAFLAASVGLIETLMTMNLVDELTETRGNGNKECVAQGAGNIVSGLFGGTGGCGMIGQTVINVNAGGRGRLSGVMMAVSLLSFILFADKLIEMVPIAALVGVMFMMVIETFAWSSFRVLKKIPKSDAIVLITVSLVTVFVDLAVAVFIGVIISALVFAWENAKKIRARKRFKEDGTKVYEIWGPLFFGSITAFNEKFDAKNDPEKVVIDFVESRVSDHSAIEAIFNIVQKYEAEGKSIKLKHLSEDCKILLYKASPKFKSVIIEDVDDPRYHLAANPEDFEKPLSEYKF